MPSPLEVFCCYARENQEMLVHLKKRLALLERQGQITIWSDTNIDAGMEWKKELHRHLESADIILLLISPDFISSEYCYSTEMMRAIERHNEGSAHVIPILLRPTLWKNAPFAKLQMIPTNAKPVTSWFERDEAWHDIAMQINQTVSKLYTMQEGRQPLSGLKRQTEARKRPSGTSRSGESNLQKLVPPPSPTTRSTHIQLTLPKKTLMLLSILLLVAGTFSLSVFWHNISFLPTQANHKAPPTVAAAATATTVAANPDPYTPTQGKLALYDPLNQPDLHWTNISDSSFGGTAQFTGGAYHISESHPRSFYPSFDTASDDFSNFAFEVQMTIIKGDCGIVGFRLDPTKGSAYYFRVCQDGKPRDGSYGLWLYLDSSGNNVKNLTNGSSTAIHSEYNQPNVIAVVANGSRLDLYVNHQKISSVYDATLSHGIIALDAFDYQNPTEVIYSNAKVWTF